MGRRRCKWQLFTAVSTWSLTYTCCCWSVQWRYQSLKSVSWLQLSSPPYQPVRETICNRIKLLHRSKWDCQLAVRGHVSWYFGGSSLGKGRCVYDRKRTPCMCCPVVIVICCHIYSSINLLHLVYVVDVLLCLHCVLTGANMYLLCTVTMRIF